MVGMTLQLRGLLGSSFEPPTPLIPCLKLALGHIFFAWIGIGRGLERLLPGI